MSMFTISIFESFKDRLFEYMFKRCLADYLHEGCVIKNSKLNFYDGKVSGKINNIVLSKHALNRKLSNTFYLKNEFAQYFNAEDADESHPNLPIEFIDNAFISEIEAEIPYSKLLIENIVVNISGTKIYLKLSLLSEELGKQIKTNIQESIASSIMVESIQIAEDLIENMVKKNELNKKNENDKANGFEGYEALTNIIKSAISRIELTLTDLSIILTDNNNSTVIEIKVNKAQMCEAEIKSEDKNTNNNKKTSSDKKIEDDFNEFDAENFIEIDDKKNKKNSQNKKENKKDDGQEKKKVAKTISKKILIEGLEILIDNKTISKIDSNHTILYSVDEYTDIQIALTSVVHAILTPKQLSSFIKVFSNKADESEFDKVLANSNNVLKDKLISKEDMKKVDEFLKEERKRGLFEKPTSSSKIDQVWAAGFGKQDQEKGKTFYSFSKDDSIYFSNEQKETENKVSQLKLSFKVPGLVVSLMEDNENNIDFDELIRSDLIETIYISLDKVLNKKNHFKFIFLNIGLTYHDSILLECSEIFVSETGKEISEKLIASSGVEAGSNLSNYIMESDCQMKKIKFFASAALEINLDPTLIERIENYLDNTECDSFFESKKIKKNQLIIEKNKNNISIDFDLISIFGKLFLPVPDLTENLERKVSDIRNEIIEFDCNKVNLNFNLFEIKATCEFASFSLNDSYVDLRRIHKNADMFYKSNSNNLSVELCQFRPLGPTNLVEIKIKLNPSISDEDFIPNHNVNIKRRTKKRISENMEDSVYVNTVYNLDAIKYIPFKTRKRIFRENKKDEDLITPNDKTQSITYLNAASKVSKLSVYLSIPQLIVIIKSKEDLNMIYNRLGNDISLWKPFNGVKKSVPNNNQTSLRDLEGNLLDSSGNLTPLDESFAYFDANIASYIQTAKNKKDLNEASIYTSTNKKPENEYLISDDQMQYFAKPQKSVNPMTASMYECKSLLDESSDSEAIFHSMTHSIVNPIYDLNNSIVFLLTVKEASIHFENNVDDNANEGLLKEDRNESQSLTSKDLLIGCVIKLEEEENTTRIFIHGDSVNLKSFNLNPVTELQAATINNKQYFLITSNKLVNDNSDCKLNIGIEISPKSNVLKKIKIVVQLMDGLMLQLNVDQYLKFWKNINLVDEEIQGYNPPNIVTEIYINLINAAIMFDKECICNNAFKTLKPNQSVIPKSLKETKKQCPCKTNDISSRPGLLIAEDAYISCLVSEQTSETVLRFIFDETAFFLMKKLPTYNNKIDNPWSPYCINTTTKILEDLNLNNYVCVLDSGFLETNFNLIKGEIKEIRISNNLIQLKGCSDSIAAFFAFMQQFSSKENEASITSKPLSSDVTSPNKPENTQPPMPYNYNPMLTPEKPLYDASFLEDNEEDIRIINNNKKPVKKKHLSSSSGKSNSPNSTFNRDENQFFIIGDDDFGTGIRNRVAKEPEFKPLETLGEYNEYEHLDSPEMINVPKKNELIANFRFLLEDMSINVHVFGGRDFEESYLSTSSDNQNKRMDSDTLPKRHSKTYVRFNDLENNSQTKPYNQELHLIKYCENYSKFDYVSLNFGRLVTYVRKKSGIFNSSGIELMQGEFIEDLIWEELDLKKANNFGGNKRPDTSIHLLKSKSGEHRNNDLQVKFFFLKLKCLFERCSNVFPISWRLDFSCNQIEILDYVKNSEINKIMYEYVSDQVPKRSNPMLSMNMVCYRSLICDQKVDLDGTQSNYSEKISEIKSNSGKASTNRIYDPTSEECDLRVSGNPIRLNIDQDTIIFLMDFFNEISLHFELICTNMVSMKENIELMNANSSDEANDKVYLNSYATSNYKESNKSPIFIKYFEFSQDLPIKLDYHGKRVNMGQGAITGLLMGLGQLNQSELILRKLVHRSGILGFEKVFIFALDSWGTDIKRRQLPSILGGVGPVHSFVQLFQGIRDLFVMPIDQYRKDKRIVRGLQKGLFSFSTCSTLALLELTNKAVNLITYTAQAAHDLMSVNSLRRERSLASAYESNLRGQQPRDAREGALSAYNVISEGFQQASRNLSSGNRNESLVRMMSRLPANVLLPLIHSSRATSNMIIGVRNQMTPQARKEDQDKWKH